MAVCMGKENLPKAGDMVSKVEGLLGEDNCLDVYFTNGNFVPVHVAGEDVKATRVKLQKKRESNMFIRVELNRSIPDDAVDAIKEQITDLLKNHDAYKEFSSVDVKIEII